MSFVEKPFVPGTLLQKVRDAPDAPEVEDVEEAREAEKAEDADGHTRPVLH